MSRKPHISTALAEATWQVSSYSGGQGNCVEVAGNLPGIILVRDSKDPAGPVLRFNHQAWAAFLDHVR